MIERVEHGLRSICEIILAGSVPPIRCTRSHHFLTEYGWRSARDLGPGYGLQLASADGSVRMVEVVNIRDTDSYEKVMNLRTYGEANFIVDGAVAHNFVHFKVLRRWLQNWRYEARQALAESDVWVHPA